MINAPAASLFTEVNPQTDNNGLILALPNLEVADSFVRKTDTPTEYEYRGLCGLDTPCRVSIKFDNIANIYNSASYINADNRSPVYAGTRNSVSYSEAVYYQGSDGEKIILPVTATFNVTMPNDSTMDGKDRIDFMKRAIGAFLGFATDDITDTAQYADVIRRQYGALKPSHGSEIG